MIWKYILKFCPRPFNREEMFHFRVGQRPLATRGIIDEMLLTLEAPKLYIGSAVCVQVCLSYGRVRWVQLPKVQANLPSIPYQWIWVDRVSCDYIMFTRPSICPTMHLKSRELY